MRSSTSPNWASAAACASADRLLDRPNGMMLVTGPTGSGKTTTLYAALQTLNSREPKS